MKEAPSSCSANYVPLSPISFLERAATVYGDKPSIVDGDVILSWKETHGRCLRLASALLNLGISHLDVVAVLAPNSPELYELHFAVPMAGAVISALDTKLDATTLALILEQLEAKIMFVDYQFVEVVLNSFNIIMSHGKCKPPLLVVIPDNNKRPSFIFKKNLPPYTLNFNQLLEKGQADFEIRMPRNECDPISVNYKSGSTGTPKGAVYSHRGAYLNSMAAISRFDMKPMAVFLWTVDMFRCNGWCLTWAMATLGGTNVCLRNVSAKAMFKAISLHNVTHLCGSPALLNVISDAPQKIEKKCLPLGVSIIVAGVLPPFQAFCKVAELGFSVNVGYGMTEAMGPVLVRPWKPNTEHISYGDHQGLPMIMMEGVDVKDPNTMESTPCDGKTIGEIMFKGNTMMLGYLKNQEAKWENHWKYDEHNNMEESPYVVIELKEGCGANLDDIIRFCRARLGTHMVPQSVVFEMKDKKKGEKSKIKLGMIRKIVKEE